jgi:hypothetical protein
MIATLMTRECLRRKFSVQYVTYFALKTQIRRNIKSNVEVSQPADSLKKLYRFIINDIKLGGYAKVKITFEILHLLLKSRPRSCCAGYIRTLMFI